jgi:hypothetical protein
MVVLRTSVRGRPRGCRAQPTSKGIVPSSIEPKLREIMALCPNLAAFIDNRNTIHVFPRSTYWIRTTLRQGKEVPAAFEAPGLQTLTLLASGNETEEVDCFPLKVQAICQHFKRLDEIVLTLPVTDFTSSRHHSIVRDPFPPALEHVGKLRILAITSADPLDMMWQLYGSVLSEVTGYIPSRADSFLLD